MARKVGRTTTNKVKIKTIKNEYPCYVIMNNYILAATELYPTSRIILSYLWNHPPIPDGVHIEETGWPTKKKLITMLGGWGNVVEQCLSQLQDAGLVEKLKLHDGTTVYRPTEAEVVIEEYSGLHDTSGEYHEKD